MRLFRRLMAWQKYLATQVALAEADEKYYARKLTRKEKMYDQRKAADKEAAANDPALQELQDAAIDYDAYRRLVSAVADGVSSDTFLCSRELTRRLGTADRTSRDNRWNT
jgi:hypothetical protein